MAKRYNILFELLFGALLATVVAFAPKYLMGLRLGLDICKPDCLLSYTCPGVWIYMSSIVLISVALIHSLCRRWHVVLQLIWLLISLYFCLLEVNTQACLLNEIKSSRDVIGPVVSGLTFVSLVCSAAYQCMAL